MPFIPGSLIVHVVVASLVGFAWAAIAISLLNVHRAAHRKLLYAGALLAPLVGFAAHSVIPHGCSESLPIGSIGHFACLTGSWLGDFGTLLVASGLITAASQVVVVWLAYSRVMRMSRDANEVGDLPHISRALAVLDRVCARAGMNRPRMLITYRPGVCCVVGIRNPAILLSEDICEILDDQELEAVLTHEVAHVRHKDNLVGLIASIVRALTYYAPTMHMAMRHYMEEREKAADDYVIESGGESIALASGVVKVWRAQAPAIASPSSDAAGRGVVSRLERLMYTSGGVDPGSLPLVIFVTALLLAVILALC